MTWAKFDDGYPENRKVLPVSAYATLLHLFAILRCARLESDGFLTKNDLEVVMVFAKIPAGKRAKVLKELTAAKLLVYHGEKYEVHDYLDYNPSHAELEAKRASGAKRVKDWRSNGRSNRVCNGVTPPVSNGVCAERPDPPLLSSLDLGTSVSGSSPPALSASGSDQSNPRAKIRPRTAYDLISIMRCAIEKHQPQNGPWSPGNSFSTMEAQKFLEGFADLGAALGTIEKRIVVFAADAAMSPWTVEKFVRNFNGLESPHDANGRPAPKPVKYHRLG